MFSIFPFTPLASPLGIQNLNNPGTRARPPFEPPSTQVRTWWDFERVRDQVHQVGLPFRRHRTSASAVPVLRESRPEMAPCNISVVPIASSSNASASAATVQEIYSDKRWPKLSRLRNKALEYFKIPLFNNMMATNNGKWEEVGSIMEVCTYQLAIESLPRY